MSLSAKCLLHPQGWVEKTTGRVASYIALTCFRQHHEYLDLLANKALITEIILLLCQDSMISLWAFKMQLLFQIHVSLYIYFVE